MTAGGAKSEGPDPEVRVCHRVRGTRLTFAGAMDRPMSATEAPTANLPAPTFDLSARRAGTILAVLASAALLVNFIETMLVPALPTLASFFDGASYTTVAWVLSLYLLVGVCTTPIFAKLGDLYGKRRILLVVLAAYAFAVSTAPFTPQIATLLGVSRANALYLLIAVRGVQGLGLAMFPLALAMVGEELPAARVGPAQGLIAAMFAVGAAAGLFGGSWLIESFGWQAAYEIVIVPALLVLGFATRLPESRHRLAAKLDIPGAALLGATLGTFLLGLTLGPSWGWGAWDGGSSVGVPLGVPELFVLSGILAVLFYVRQRTAEHPIINLHRLAERNIGLSYLTALLVGAGLFLAFVTLTILVEVPVVGLGKSIFAFGLMSLPTTLSMLIAAPLVGRGVARYGPRPMIVLGSAVSSVGFLLLLVSHASYIAIMVEAVPTFVGLVTMLVSATNVVVLSSHRGETGIQTGMTEMFQDLGASVAPVVASSIMASLTATYSVPIVTTAGVRTASVVLPEAAAFQWIFAVGLAITLVCGVLGAFVRNYRFAVDETPAETSAAPAPAVEA